MQKYSPFLSLTTKKQNKIMILVFRMSSEKKERMTSKIDKMMDFLEEFRDCLENASEEEYRSNYREEMEDDKPKPRYRYRR